MRMRYKAFAIPELKENDLVFFEPEENKGQWSKIFKNNNPIHLEIGAGFGKFILTKAERNQNINYIGVELDEKVLVYAARDFKESGLKNIIGIRNKAENLTKYFEKGEIKKIYLNFSNPWPKRSQHKRRLTHPQLLNVYKKIIPIEAEIVFKTDQRTFFDDSIKYFERNGFKILDLSYDLGVDDIEDHIVTEYEQKWRENGDTIHYLRAKLIDDAQSEVLEIYRK